MASPVTTSTIAITTFSPRLESCHIDCHMSSIDRAVRWSKSVIRGTVDTETENRTACGGWSISPLRLRSSFRATEDATTRGSEPIFARGWALGVIRLEAEDAPDGVLERDFLDLDAGVSAVDGHHGRPLSSTETGEERDEQDGGGYAEYRHQD